ncbi:diguanylate cyclase [Thermodesulfobium narugense DSM 14796]|uniref:diguanylate cyclase n=1 Tax=Thermodesulfobium narugense DSM 14796 TaxID=747365 RepID=M1E8M2_9BACT|nr:GGDEF domain-containing protein [Thermodesulfobium narugense]AEE14559.1 diguanylate cyclase [Thermodesulfobium narugense DSM 14796]
MKSDDIGQFLFKKIQHFVDNVPFSNKLLNTLFLNILENIEEAFVVYDNNFNSIFYNSNYLKILPLDLETNNSFTWDIKEEINVLSKKVLNLSSFSNKIPEILDFDKETFDIIEFKDGKIIERRSVPLLCEQLFKGKILFYKDITNKIHESLSTNLDKELTATLIQKLPFYLLIVDKNFNVIFANQQARELDNISSKCYSLLFGRESQCNECQLENVINKHINFASEIELKNKKTFSIMMSGFKDSLENELATIFAMDITRYKEIEKQNLYLSYIDPLTEIFNRRGFFAYAKKNFNQNQLNFKKLFLFFFDLDGLKKINDAYGHIKGDIAIKNFAKILKSSFRENDLIARFGGDEFIVLVRCRSKKDSIQILERLKSKTNDFNSSKKLEFEITFSYGISEIKPDQLSEIENIIHQADQAMYLDKRQKRAFY